MNTLHYALLYFNAGLSIIPIAPDGTKRPDYALLPCDDCGKPTWQPFQRQRPTLEDITRWFSPVASRPTPGIAILGGQVSGGLEILDLDNQLVVEPWRAAVQRHAPGLLDRLVLVRTPRPGLHVYYRAPQIEGNQKLAQERTGDGQRTIIETRGEGGYVLAPGSPPESHPTRRTYEFCGASTMPCLTVDERAILLSAARSLNRLPPSVPATPQVHLPSSSASRSGDRVGDDFNRRASWEQILLQAGWTLVGSRGREELWRRPGKASGSSATTGHDGRDILYVFSSNASPFEPNSAYTKFAAYAHLRCRGNFSLAARELARQGYGQLAGYKNRRTSLDRPRLGG
jgi:putative DNA primase/helicase